MGLNTFQGSPFIFLNTQLSKSLSCYLPNQYMLCFTNYDGKSCSLTMPDFQSIGINNAAPQWGNADHIMLAFDEGHRLGAAGLVSTQPWFTIC